MRRSKILRIAIVFTFAVISTKEQHGFLQSLKHQGVRTVLTGSNDAAARLRDIIIHSNTKNVSLMRIRIIIALSFVEYTQNTIYEKKEGPWVKEGDESVKMKIFNRPRPSRAWWERRIDGAEGKRNRRTVGRDAHIKKLKKNRH